MSRLAPASPLSHSVVVSIETRLSYPGAAKTLEVTATGVIDKRYMDSTGRPTDTFSRAVAEERDAVASVPKNLRGFAITVRRIDKIARRGNSLQDPRMVPLRPRFPR